MAEIILPPEENEETPQEPELNIDKPNENSKVITIEFEAKKTNKVSTKDTNQQLYTTDTDAWFEFKETSLEGANGTYSVVFRNRHDGSIFQRTGDVVNGVAYYKIPHQEIRHAGAWRGQIVYTLSNGDTTAREFDYDVKGHILDGKDVREIVVEDFETLMSQLRSMKDNAEVELANLVNTAEQNETDRQAFFDDLVEDIDELQANYQELLDTGVLQTNINTKLEALEEEYAPKLTEVTAQLAQKITRAEVSVNDIDKNKGKLDQTYMTDEFLQQVAGTASVNATPADRSLTTEKFAFPVLSGRKSKNLFNKDSSTIGQAVEYTNGKLYPQATYAVSDFIPVLANTAYVRTRNTPIAFYNSAKVYISGILSGLTFTTPADTAFVRINVDGVANLPTEQLELGTVSTPYESYESKLANNSVSLTNLEEILQNEFISQVPFGTNPAFSSVNNWSVPSSLAGTWRENDSFVEGTNYLEVVNASGEPVSGVFYYQDIHSDYVYDISRKARVKITYISDANFSLYCFQQKEDKSWTADNTPTMKFVNASDKEITTELIVPLKIDGVRLAIGAYGIPDNATVKIGSVKFSIIGNEKDDKSTTVVTVKKDGTGDFITIQEAIDGVVGREDEPMDIVIHEGIYTEEIRGKHWINLIGVDRDNVIIDSLPETGNVVNRDTIVAHFNMTIKNLTVKGEHVKYCIHDDNGSGHTLHLENLVLDKKISNTFGSAIGMGLRANQHMKIKNCYIRGDEWGIYYHNWNNQTAYSSLEIENSHIEGTNKFGLIAQSLGSNMTDLIILKGNKFVGGQYDVQVGRQTGYGHDQDDIVFLASGNEIRTYNQTDGSSVPLVQPIVTETIVTNV